MNDILPPQRSNRPVPPRPSSTSLAPAKRPSRDKTIPLDHRVEAPEPELKLEAAATPPPTTPSPSAPKKGWSWRRWSLLALGIVLLLSLITAIGGYMWYQSALAPVSSDKNADRVRLTIETGSTPSQIGDLLMDKKLIRSKQAFDFYTRLTGTQNNLQAGAYRLSPAESTPDIVKHLVSGNVDEITITFYPGATLEDNTDRADSKKVDVTTILRRAGYSDAEIATGLKKSYNHPVFSGKPTSADLEGYVYGETYNFATSATVEDILTRTFDELYKVVQDNKLEAAYKAQGLTLYEGITLASIIQREVPAADDQKQVAQVFLKRYREGTVLGSDITAYYGADKLGVARTVAVDTPYNTRLHAGLPPTPIAAPGLSALLAVANPAEGDYLYFLSGDDEVTYFARTNEQHEANIKAHCAVKCAVQ